MAEHISRKELKQDKIKETFEHGAEAVYSHSQLAIVVIATLLVVALAYGGWSFYSERKNNAASAALDVAMKAYGARIRTANEPVEAGEVTYPDEQSRLQDAQTKFASAADKYPSTNAGKLARYYSALCLEDLEKHNQALEELKRLDAGSDKELAAMAQYQVAVINARTGKPDEAVKIFRSLADNPTVLVPKPLVLLELANLLRQSNPQEATTIYQQIKKDYPDTPVSDEADRGLDTLAPKS